MKHSRETVTQWIQEIRTDNAQSFVEDICNAMGKSHQRDVLFRRSQTMQFTGGFTHIQLVTYHYLLSSINHLWANTLNAYEMNGQIRKIKNKFLELVNPSTESDVPEMSDLEEIMVMELLFSIAETVDIVSLQIKENEGIYGTYVLHHAYVTCSDGESYEIQQVDIRNKSGVRFFVVQTDAPHELEDEAIEKFSALIQKPLEWVVEVPFESIQTNSSTQKRKRGIQK